MKSQLSLSARSLFAFAIGLFISGAGIALGIFLGNLWPNFDAAPLHFILIATMAVLCIGNRLAAGIFADRHFSMTAEERQAFLDEHRAVCARDPEAVLKKLEDISSLPVTLLSLYYLLTLGMMVTGAMAKTVTVILPVLLLLMPLVRYMALLSPRLNKNPLVPTGQMPLLHTIVHKAASMAGVRGTFRLQITADAICDVTRFGRTYVVFLGTRALSIMTEDELTAYLVRVLAFRPTPAEDRRLIRHYRLATMGSAKPRVASCVFDVFFSVADAYLEWYAPLYNMAFNYRTNRRAADSLAREGMTRTYLNAQAKSLMWDYFDFEWFSHLKEPFYAPETQIACYEKVVCSAFRDAVKNCSDSWSVWLPHKLPPAGYLGLSYAEERRLLGAEDSPIMDTLRFSDVHSDFFTECIAAMERITSPIPKASYDASRKEYYLDRLAVIAAWEASDKNWPTSELSPVINAYRFLNRHAEMEALCDRILETEPNYFAQAHAIYEKGICLLWRYDVTGIDFIYRAMDLNKNYMKDGLEVVDIYCRLCGLSDELEACRRRAATLIEAHGANHEGASHLSPTDHLVPETELNDQLPAILEYMITSGEGTIERIYLVRKIISEDFFSSVFVLYFTPGSDEDTMHRAYEAIFHYLDGYPIDWQFSLFLYDRETEMAVKRVAESLVWMRKDE